MTRQTCPEEFKTEAVKQITERGHQVADVSARLGVSQHSLYKWIKAHAQPAGERQAQSVASEELRRLDVITESANESIEGAAVIGVAEWRMTAFRSCSHPAVVSDRQHAV